MEGESMTVAASALLDINTATGAALVDGKPIPCHTPFKWGMNEELLNQMVKDGSLQMEGEGYRLSTMLLKRKLKAIREGRVGT